MSNRSYLRLELSLSFVLGLTLLNLFGGQEDALNYSLLRSFPSGNLIENGSFEGNYSRIDFDGWYQGPVANADAYQQLLALDFATPRSGHKFAGIRFYPPSGDSRFLVSNLFTLKPNTWYTFFIYYQTNLFDPTKGNVYASFKTYKDRNVATSEVPFPTSGHAKAGDYASVSSWTQYTHRFYTGSQANFGDVALLSASGVGEGGAFFFDDAYLVEGCVRVSTNETLPTTCPEDIAFGLDARHPDSIGITQKFFDGNEKLVQTLSQDGPRDIVTQVFYDEQGHPVKNTLPIGAEFTGNPHNFVPGITGTGDASDVLSNFYDPSKTVYIDDPVSAPLGEKYPDAGHVPYSEVRYEVSALSRELESASPGSPWAMGGGHTNLTSYTSVPNLDAADDASLPDPFTGASSSNFFAKERTGPDGQITREITDKFGRLVRSCSKLGAHWIITDYNYDEMGNLISIKAPQDPTGIRLSRVMEYNPLGQVAAESTQATGKTRFFYDAAGRVRFTQTANQAAATKISDGKFSYVKYDALGRAIQSGEITDASLFTPEKAELPEFPCISSCVDQASLITSDLVKIRTQNLYDNGNGVLSCGSQGGNPSPGDGVRFLGKDPMGHIVSASYDLVQTYNETATRSQGQSGFASILALYQPDGDLFVAPRLDAEIKFIGNLSFSIEGLPLNTPDGIDALAAFNVFQSQRYSSILGAGEFLQGRLVQSVTCNYELAEALGESSPREVSKTYRYDKYGNVTKMLEVNGYTHEISDMTQLTLNAYDTQNRLLQKKVCSDLSTDPNCNGPLIHVENYRYDRMGRIQQVLDKAGNVIVMNHFNYVGQASARGLGGDVGATSGNGLLEKTTRHIRGWLRTSTTKKQLLGSEMFRSTLTYEGIGPGSRFDGNISTASYSYGSGTALGNIRYIYGYDDVNRLVSSAVDPASSVTNASSSYEYMDDGRIFKMIRDVRSGIYAYSPKGRLKEITGNLVDKRDMSLASHGSFVFDYDSSGNTITDDSKKKDNQPLEIFYRADNLPYMFIYKKPNASDGYDELVDYMAYDEKGDRVTKSQYRNDAWETSRNYFSSGKEVRERNPGGSYSSLELYGMDGIGNVTYSQVKPDGYKEYFVTDNIGTTREVYDFTTGALTYASNYFPYGKQFGEFSSTSKGDVRLSTESITKKFTGKEIDEGTELNYFGARYYDQDIGLWISPDPSRQFVASYLYAGNGTNPISGWDASGNRLVMDKSASATFKTEFATAISYLNKGGASSVIAKLEARPEVITVKEGPLPGQGPNGSDYFDDQTNELYWNPTSALNTNGAKQTPALGLLHEASHALQSVSNPTQFKKDAQTPVKLYDDAEEKRVIDLVETPAAKKLGEGTRTQHSGGTEYPVQHADQR